MVILSDGESASHETVEYVQGQHGKMFAMIHKSTGTYDKGNLNVGGGNTKDHKQNTKHRNSQKEDEARRRVGSTTDSYSLNALENALSVARWDTMQLCAILVNSVHTVYWNTQIVEAPHKISECSCKPHEHLVNQDDYDIALTK